MTLLTESAQRPVCVCEMFVVVLCIGKKEEQKLMNYGSSNCSYSSLKLVICVKSSSRLKKEIVESYIYTGQSCVKNII